MLFGNDRNQMRRYFCEVWRKAEAGIPLEPLERIIVAVIAQHPEYQALLSDPDTAMARDYPLEVGETNPFLHLGMHIAIQEQLSSNRPAGIREVYGLLRRRFNDDHTAEHHMMECLGETLWEAQRNGTPPDEALYLQRLRRLLWSS
jgi:hypothetical protein